MAKKTNILSDSAYFLKLVVLLILGSLWVKTSSGQGWHVPLPVGFVIGLLLASQEHFKIDRKIQYALLLVSMLIGFWLPIGIFIRL